LVPNSPRSIEKSNEDKPPSHSSVAAESNLKPDSEKSKLDSIGVLSEFVSEDDHDMDDEESDIESEEDYVEERWRSTEEAFEASVVRATGNNLELAARLIPQLYEIFQQEQSPVIGFWETCYRERGGPSYVPGSGTQGGDQPLGGYSGQDTNTWKRQKRADEDDRGDYRNNQGGDRDRDGNRKNTNDTDAESKTTLHLACPFNKRQPKIYNRFHGSPEGKGEYNICESGIPNDKDFR